MSRVLRVAVALAAIGAGAPGVALAGTVSLEGGVLTYRADPGVWDHFYAAPGQGYIGVGMLNSPELSAGDGCLDLRPADYFADPPVHCPLAPGAPLPRLRVDLRDGDDSGGFKGELRG